MATQAVMERVIGSYGGKTISDYVSRFFNGYSASNICRYREISVGCFCYPLCNSSDVGRDECCGSQHHLRENDSSVSKIDRLIMLGLTGSLNYYLFNGSVHSWERGANENTNGLIRQYIPIGTDFSEITDEFVSWVENKLNNRPRKRLGYLTPNEKFNSILTN